MSIESHERYNSNERRFIGPHHFYLYHYCLCFALLENEFHGRILLSAPHTFPDACEQLFF